ncbi:MAG: hypothetical protein ABI885_12825 [Gammaproteobacteria bacterium]
MSAVLLAIFNDYASADQVRMNLFQDGFPTDRVELTAGCEPGRAALQAENSPHGRFVKYFSALLPGKDERQFAERFAERLDEGAAAITVHPRGLVETSRATEILEYAHPSAVLQHDISHQAFEHAAARSAKPWISHLWVENTSNAHCIYCALFERNLP